MTKQDQIELRKLITCKGGVTIKSIGGNYLQKGDIGVGDGAELSRNTHFKNHFPKKGPAIGRDSF